MKWRTELYIGLDPGSHFAGLSALDNLSERPVLEVEMTCNPKLFPYYRLQTIADEFRRELSEALVPYEYALCVIERPFAKNRTNFGFQCRQMGYFLNILTELGVDIVDADSGTIKSFVRYGCKTKPRLHQLIRELWDYQHESSDVMDAFAMAKMARAIVHPELAHDANARRKISELIQNKPSRYMITGMSIVR